MSNTKLRLNCYPVVVPANWNELNCHKFQSNERINRWLCRARFQELTDVGRVDCRDCENRPEIRRWPGSGFGFEGSIGNHMVQRPKSEIQGPKSK